MVQGISFTVDNMKVIFTEKDIPMLKDAISSLRLQVRLNKEALKREVEVLE